VRDVSGPGCRTRRFPSISRGQWQKDPAMALSSAVIVVGLIAVAGLVAALLTTVGD
jgi:hypothetical protein